MKKAKKIRIPEINRIRGIAQLPGMPKNIERDPDREIDRGTDTASTKLGDRPKQSGDR
jgi:hypothetical protein